MVMEQPTQPEPSIETWEEACVISQEWADGARKAALKRRDRRALVSMILVLALVAIALALVIILTDWEL